MRLTADGPNVLSENGTMVVAYMAGADDDPKRATVAAELVRRWNAHEGLVAALGECDEMLRGLRNGTISQHSNSVRHLHVKLSAALADAKGEEVRP